MHMVKFKDLDSTPLQQIDLNYKAQTSIPQERVDMFTACAIHYNFDISSVIRYTCGNYTNAHLKVESIIATLSSAGCDKKLMDELQRILTKGSPVYFNASSTQENFKVFAQHRKRSTIAKNIAKVMKTINKQTKYS